jgi:hypothetical protein
MLQSVSGEPNSSMKIPRHNSPMISVTQRGAAILLVQDPWMRFGVIIRDRLFSCVRFNRYQCYLSIKVVLAHCFKIITELLQYC